MIDSVPLIQNANDAQQINASIIAMKKASRELDEKIVKLNSLNSELDKKIALLDSGLNKEIEDRKEAIKSLDVASVGGSGKYISAISETDGKISATVSNITSSVSSGNSQPVTSGGVFNAIDKINYSASARNIDTLYPSENGKSEVFGGNFSGNVPEPTQTAILKTFRISSAYTSEVQIYQEWEAYGATSDYAPNQYFRFGYFTGSASPTWSPWQKIIITEELNKFIKYKEVSISSITLTANGYADISSYMPSGMNNFLFAILYNYGNISTKDALGVIGAGTYLFGTANATIANIVLRYYYFD